MSVTGAQAVIPIGLKKVSNFGGVCVACRRNPFPHPVAQTKYDDNGSNEKMLAPLFHRRDAENEQGLVQPDTTAPLWGKTLSDRLERLLELVSQESSDDFS